MKTLLSCEFNMDTGCVELRYSDDSMISIKQNINHYSVIYRMVMVVCGKVAIFTVSLASPPNGKVDGVLLRTALHGRSSERFLRSN